MVPVKVTQRLESSVQLILSFCRCSGSTMVILDLIQAKYGSTFEDAYLINPKPMQGGPTNAPDTFVTPKNP